MEEVPNGVLDENVENEIEKTYKDVSRAIESLEFKSAIEKVMDLVEFGNKYYDEKQPWIQKKEDIEGFNNTIYNCTNIIANLSNLFEPFMPASCTKIREYLAIEDKKWEKIHATPGIRLDNIEPLFTRI
jgi:methionyl-tRNA synthetase